MDLYVFLPADRQNRVGCRSRDDSHFSENVRMVFHSYHWHGSLLESRH